VPFAALRIPTLSSSGVPVLRSSTKHSFPGYHSMINAVKSADGLVLTSAFYLLAVVECFQFLNRMADFSSCPGLKAFDAGCKFVFSLFAVLRVGNFQAQEVKIVEIGLEYIL
jgi:hypothetical protein